MLTLNKNYPYHFMKTAETIAIIRPWSGGNNQYSLYITIPSKIVKLMDISKDTILEVGILKDQTITISKYQDSKKIRSKESKPTTIQNVGISKEDGDAANDNGDAANDNGDANNSYNPLDDVF